jgi:hypothetical protein
MGRGRFLFLGDFGQQLDVSDQRRGMRDLRAELRRTQRSQADATTLAELRAENDDLRLNDTAPASLMKASSSLAASRSRALCLRVPDGVPRKLCSAPA